MASRIGGAVRRPLAGKIARCICCMRVVNVWAVANVNLCYRCDEHGAFVFDVGWNKRMDRPFGKDQAWVSMCNEAPEMRNKLVRIERLFEMVAHLDKQEFDSPGGGGMTDPGPGEPANGHFSGFINVEGDRMSVAEEVPRRNARGKRYYELPEGRKYLEEA